MDDLETTTETADASRQNQRGVIARPDMRCGNCGWEGSYDEVIVDETVMNEYWTVSTDVCPECGYLSPEDLHE